MSSARAGAAFVVTFALALPAGWWALDAGPPGVPGARPPLPTVEVGKTTVTLALDRSEAGFGERVAVRLVARGAATEQPEVVVSLLERRGSEMSRVPTPPLTVASERVRLGAAPDGGPAHELGFALGAPADDPVAQAGSTRTYEIVVAPATGRGSARGSTGFRFGPPVGAAMATVIATAPRAIALTVESPEQLSVAAPVALTVRVKNLTQKTLRGLNVALAGADITLSGGPQRLATLVAGQEAVLHYLATARRTTRATSYSATAYAEYGGTAAVSAVRDETGRLTLAEPSRLRGMN